MLQSLFKSVRSPDNTKPLSEPKRVETTPEKDEFLTLPVEWIEPDPAQDRRDWDSKSAQRDFASLVSSVKSQGVLEPIIVRRVGPKQYRIIAGERRWRAATQAGLDEIPCLCRARIDNRQALFDQMVENVVRRGLNHVETARSIKRRLNAGITRTEIAEATGMSLAWISRRVQLLELPEVIQRLNSSGRINDIDTLFALGKLDETARQVQLQRIEAGTFDARALRRRASVKRQRGKASGINLSIKDAVMILNQGGGANVDSTKPEAVKQAWRDYLNTLRRAVLQA